MILPSRPMKASLTSIDDGTTVVLEHGAEGLRRGLRQRDDDL